MADFNPAIEEAFKRFPDDVEPIDCHPAGKIVVDRGNLRFAFIEGARFALSNIPQVIHRDGDHNV